MALKIALVVCLAVAVVCRILYRVLSMKDTTKNN